MACTRFSAISIPLSVMVSQQGSFDDADNEETSLSATDGMLDMDDRFEVVGVSLVRLEASNIAAVLELRR